MKLNKNTLLKMLICISTTICAVFLFFKIFTWAYDTGYRNAIMHVSTESHRELFQVFMSEEEQ